MIYLDTVIGKQSIPKSELKRFGDWESTTKSDAMGVRYRKYHKLPFPVPFTKYATIEVFAESRPDGACVGFDTSLPKYKNDNNIQMLSSSDVLEIAKGINQQIYSLTGLEIDSLNAGLSRADNAHCWKMSSDEKYRRIEAAKRVTYRGEYAKEKNRDKGVPSIYFGSKNYHQFCLYDKNAETDQLVKDRKASDEHLHNSIGALRFEDSRFRNKLKEDARKLGKPEITLATYLDYPQYGEEIILNGMKIFYLDQEIAGHDERREKLKRYCGNDKPKSAKLWGFFKDVLEWGEKEALSYYGYDFARRARIDLTAAGIWLETEGRIALPALAPPSYEQAVRANLIVRSNTSDNFAPVQSFIASNANSRVGI